MGAGVIFAIVVVAGLAYLIPWYVSRRGGADAALTEEPFADSMTIIRRAGALVDPGADEFEVSTPMTRRSALYEVRRSHRVAAVRRRRGTLTLLALTVLAAIAPILSAQLPAGWPRVPGWAVAVPGGLLVVFLVVARYSVVSLTQTLDRRVEQITAGWQEDTISFQIPADLLADESEISVELTGPVSGGGSLWDAIPVTAPTYVSKPLVPRTVRTIDLSAPGLATTSTPVTNDTQPQPRVESPAAAVDEHERRRPRAVGE